MYGRGCPLQALSPRDPFAGRTDTVGILQLALGLEDPFTQGTDVVGTSQHSHEGISPSVGNLTWRTHGGSLAKGTPFTGNLTLV